MTTLKTILFAGALALGIGACHHDRAVNAPATSTYGTAPDQTPQPAPVPVESTNNNGTTADPDVNTVQPSPDVNPAPPAQTTTPTSPSAGALNSTDNSSGNNANNQQTNGQRTKGNYNNSKNSVPASSNGTNVNTDSDLDRTGNSGTTKEGNPGTADQPDR